MPADDADAERMTIAVAALLPELRTADTSSVEIRTASRSTDGHQRTVLLKRSLCRVSLQPQQPHRTASRSRRPFSHNTRALSTDRPTERTRNSTSNNRTFALVYISNTATRSSNNYCAEQAAFFTGVGPRLSSLNDNLQLWTAMLYTCLLYTSPSPRDRQKSRMPSSA